MAASQDERKVPLIMVVDDDRFSRSIISKIIEEAGYSVVQTCDGNEANNLYQYLKPDVILMDGEMPVMDGISCCTLIKQQPGAEEVPILFVTSHSEAEFVERAFAAGAEDFITKPINSAILRRRLQRVMENKRATEKFRQAYAELQEKSREQVQTSELLEREIYERQRLEALLRETGKHEK